MNELIIALFAVILFIFLRWGFKNLPLEQWQILWSMPGKKLDDGTWEGTNFTFYGFFNAGAITLATVIMFLLSGALKIRVEATFLITFGILVLTLPSAKTVACLVEKKQSTFSVGGASFIGLIVSPWIVWTVAGWFPTDLPIMGVLAALTISYAFGEGVGRLACISFGCCYGVSLKDSGKWLNKLFRHHHFIFYGNTKKISYAQKLHGQPVVPIQALTSVIFCFSGIIGLILFIKGLFAVAYLEVLGITQIWRFLSEFFRNDYRGRGNISVYQKLSLVSLVYGLFIFFLFPAQNYPYPSLVEGFFILWNPFLIIFFQLLWLVSFIFLGRSQVTGAKLSFHIRQEKI